MAGSGICQKQALCCCEPGESFTTGAEQVTTYFALFMVVISIQECMFPGGGGCLKMMVLL